MWTNEGSTLEAYVGPIAGGPTTSFPVYTIYTNATTSSTASPIRQAPGTTDLDKLVAETREQIRTEGEMQLGNYVAQPCLNTFVYSFPPVKEEPKIIVVESPRRWSRRDEAEVPIARETVGVEEAHASEVRHHPPAESSTASAAACQQISSLEEVDTIALESAPAAVVHAIAKRILTPDLYARYVEPQFADMWHEYCIAIRNGEEKRARLVVRRGLWEVSKPLLFAIIRTAFRVWKIVTGG